MSLDSAAKGMGLPGKSAGLSGALAPKWWAAGKHRQVLDYVAQDVRTALALAQIGAERSRLSWIARSGKKRDLALPSGWLQVDQARTCPEPDTSWMSKPLPRTKFTAWLGQAKIKR